MIIKSICLENFGKFHNKTLDFSEGMNIMYGENEAGKTTLHTFIKGMLFGLESRYVNGPDDNEYEKYIPWDDPTNYKGSMLIEADGVEYKIYRNFLKSEKSLKIIRMDSGRELSREEIEKLFYGFDESCYYNTISISQLGSITSKELEKVLKNYASNLGSTKTTEINLEEALSNLEKTKHRLMQEGNTQKKTEYEEDADAVLAEINQTEAEERMIINEMDDNREKIVRLKDKIRSLEELDSDQTQQQIKKNINSENRLQKMELIRLDLERLGKGHEQAEAHKEELEKELSEFGITNKQQVEEELEDTLVRSNISLLWLAIAVLALVATLGFAIYDYMNWGGWDFYENSSMIIKEIVSAGIFGVALLALIVMVFVNKSRKKKDIQILKDLKITVDKYEAAKHEAAYADQQMKIKQKELNSMAFEAEAEKERVEQLSDYNSQIAGIKEEIIELRDEKNKLQFSLEQKKESVIRLKDQLKKIDEKLTRIKETEEEISAVDDAKQTINQISEEVRRSFGIELNKRASIYMGNITNGKYENIDIDEELNIFVKANAGKMVPVDKLSKGTIEQMYMSLRLAAADIIFKDDSKPILLDDAFVMYDNKRMANTMRFMSKNLKQMLIFSCHTREKVMADKLHLDYKLIVVDEGKKQI